MKQISVITPCYNEEQNIEELYQQIRGIFELLPQYDYEHIVIDNASTDNTVGILRHLAAEDSRLKVIVNARNFGHVRSPYYALYQAQGDAVIILASDLQEPPAMISDFLARWEDGFPMVLGVKSQSEENGLLYRIRTLYYNTLNFLSDIPLIPNFTGFGLYDQKIISILRDINDPYPYIRGLVCEIGFDKAIIEFRQPIRKRGLTKRNFFTLYDYGMVGLVSHSKAPLRVATMAGFALGLLSLALAFLYLILKLLFWNFFTQGVAPILIAIFFFSAMQLFVIGLLGEYILSIHTYVRHRPMVVEKERINF